MLLFEWDPRKARTNLRKHRVSFAEASTVFDDPTGLTVPNPLHSVEERRFVSIDRSEFNRLLVVVFAERGERIRIVSARTATPSERRQHESGT